jgi:hypothetical protein
MTFFKICLCFFFYGIYMSQNSDFLFEIFADWCFVE